jgi:hypothetical protein
MAYTNLRAPISDWLIEPRQIRPGVLLGHTLLPDTDEFAAVRMINLSGRKQCINGNILLGDAEAIGSVALNRTGEIFDSTTDDRTVDRAASNEISCTDQTGWGHCSPHPQVADGENCDSRWVSDGHGCTSLLAGCADSYGRPGADRNCFENCAKVALGPHSALNNSEPVRLNGPCTDKLDNLDGPGTGEWENRNKPDTNELGSMDAPGAYGPVAANGPGEKGPDNGYGPGAISNLGTGEVYVGPAATLGLDTAANLSSPRALVNNESFHNRSNCIDADRENDCRDECNTIAVACRAVDFPNVVDARDLTASEHGECEHLTPLVDSLPSDLTELQRAKANELIRDNRGIFSKHEFGLGLTNLVHHRIDTGQAKPRAERLRHHPRAYLDLIDEQVDKMLSAGLIEEAASP